MRILFTCLTSILVSCFASAQTNVIYNFKTDNYGGPSSTVKVGNKLFFSAFDTLHGRELWCTDGTTVGTFMVKDINPGTFNGIADYFNLTTYVMNGILYFKGDDGIFGTELWRSDGTANGTYLLKDLTPGSSASGFGYFASVNNILYFTGGTGAQLWRSDGTTAGTYVVDNFIIITNLCAFNGNLYFSADKNNSGQELWKSNGTTAGTLLLKDLNGAFGASLPCNFHATPSALYFMANTNDGWELWKTSGTNASTVMVKDINPTGDGVLNSYTEANMVNIADTIYFRANDGVSSYQLWKSDGTIQGTVMCTTIPNSIYSSCTFPVVDGKVLVNNYIDPYFYAYDPVSNTTTVSIYPSFFYINDPNKFAFTGDKMVFVAKDSLYGCEVWRADGSTQSVNHIQETHLTDNWYSLPSQGFNSIFGLLGNNVLFTKARNPYDYDIPLSVYDATQPDTCFAPSIIVAAPTSDTSCNFIWNRITDNATYQFRYRLQGNSTWSTINTNYSYAYLNNMDSAAGYEYQVSAICNSVNSNWSAMQLYNTVFNSNNYIVNILAERCENDSTVRIYWMRSPQISYIQIRYRIYGTITWTVVNSYNSYKRISGLQPNTFYEYQVRPNNGGILGVWTNTSLYFYTASILSTATQEFNSKHNRISVYPVPTDQLVYIDGLNGRKTECGIFDLSGRLIRTFNLVENTIDLSGLTGGVYLLKIKMENCIIVNKVIKQ